MTPLQQLIAQREKTLATLKRDAQELDDDTTDAVDAMVHEDAISREKGFLVDLRKLAETYERPEDLNPGF